MICLSLKRKHFMASYSWLIAALLLFSSCSFSPKTTNRYLQKAKSKNYDIIVVPGVPFTEKGWDSTMKARVYWSKYLFEQGIAKNIIYSGSSVYSPYYEGEIMALYAIAIGIPEKNVFSEIKAEHSTENLYYSYYKSKKLGFSSVALATDPFQAKQLRRYARVKVDESVGIIPIVFDTLKMMQPYMINPEINYRQAFNKYFVPITSRESFWKRFRGTMGKNVDKNAYR